MVDTAKDYDTLPYRSVAYAASSPERMAALAHLFGRPPAPPERARVLELGCASGGNILPLAVRFPEARFVGIDLSQGQVSEGQRRIAALGLSNVEIRHGDIATVDFPEGSFDYLVTHGVWSWIPEAAQDAVFRIARRCLVPDGLAYVSYNTFPGWNMRKTVRDLTLYHAGSGGAAAFRVARARWLLDKLGKMPQGGIYGQLMKQEAELNARQPDSYILGEFLADHNRPCYFHEFNARAQGAGLAFLCEADLGSSIPETLDPDTARLIREIAGGSGLAVEQYMDFFTGRQFRRSILINPGSEAEIARSLAPVRLAQLHMASTWRRDPEAIDGMERRWIEGQARRDAGPAEDLVLDRLAAAAPATVPVADLLAALHEGGSMRNDAEAAQVLAMLLRLVLSPGIELLAVPRAAGRATDERPEVCPLARFEASQRQDWLSSRRHKPVAFPASMLQLLPMIDGTRSAADLAGIVAQAIIAGSLTQDDAPIGAELDDAARADLADRIVAGILGRLEAAALLVPARDS